MKLLLSLVLFTVFIAPAARATPEDDTLRDFYHWYVHALNQNERAEPMKSPQIHRYVTGHFLRQLAEQAKHSDLDGGGLDYDPFLMSQDWDKEWEHNITIKDGHQAGSKWVTQVTLSGKKLPTQRLNLVLVQEAGTWKIDQVSDVEKHQS